MSKKQLHYRQKLAFTLIELLVVVAIIVVLIALLLPSLSQAREQAKKVACASNQRQVGVMIAMFASDNQNKLPFYRFPASGTKWTFVSMLMGAEEVAMGCSSDRAPDTYNATNYLQNTGSLKVFQCTAQATSRMTGDQNGTFGISVGLSLNGTAGSTSAPPNWPTGSKLSQYNYPVGNTFMACSNKNRAYIEGYRCYFGTDSNSAMGGYHPGISANFLYMDWHVENHNVTVNTTNSAWYRAFGWAWDSYTNWK